MSQQGALTSTGSGGSPVETLTGNSGGPVGPDGSFNINILGNNTTGINVVGMPGSNTLSIVGIQATTTQRGTVELATDAEAIAGTDTANALTSSNLAAKLGTQTAHSLAVFEGSSSALTALGAATNGQLPIGSTGADPVLATLTAGSGISISNGAGSISISVNGASVGETITGNTGGALSPSAGNWNIIGGSTAAGTTPVATAGAGNTLTINVQKSQAIAATDATKVGLANFNSTQFSVDANGFVSTSGTGILNTLTGNSGGTISPTAGNINTLGTGSITIAGSGSTLTTQLTGLTNHAVQVGAGTATLTQLAVGTNGQVLIGATAADPAFATLTSSDSSISFTTGANTLSLQVAGGSTTIKTITGNSGGAESPSAGNFNILGTGSITVAGSANTETVQLTGLTNHSLLVGAGTATITNLGVATNGQLPIGSVGADPVLATLTAGIGIAITNGAGSISIAATGAGFTWSDTSGTVTAVAENGYFITGATTSTLPASPSEGDTVKYIVDTASALTITAAGSQLIRVANTISAAGGTSVNTQRGDAMTLVYRATGTTWFAENFVGAWTTT